MTLPDQLPAETVIKIIRRDFFTLFQKICLFVLLLGIVLVMRLLIPETLGFAISAGFYPVFMLGGYAFILFAWLLLFFSVVDYYLDVWYVTNLRIIDIHQEGFFSRKVSEQFLNRVQDVTTEITGLMPTLLKYGSVKIQTAGEQEHFLFEQVPDPEAIRKLIMELIEKNHVETTEPTQA